jgi:hypothetical protein
MIATFTTLLANNLWSVGITTEVTSVERALIDAYGEPQVDKAGTINYTDNSDNPQTFVIAGSPQLVFIRSGTPFGFSMSALTDPLAKNKVAGWATTLQARMLAAMTALKANPPVTTPSVNNVEM